MNQAGGNEFNNSYVGNNNKTVRERKKVPRPNTQKMNDRYIVLRKKAVIAYPTVLRQFQFGGQNWPTQGGKSPLALL